MPFNLYSLIGFGTFLVFGAVAVVNPETQGTFQLFAAIGFWAGIGFFIAHRSRAQRLRREARAIPPRPDRLA
ncbi:MAG: hypothetical protein WD556_06215 [Actinomycetota bacterium]